MKILKYLSIVLAGVVLFIACQKEYSVESGYAGMIATGSLLDTAGDCRDIAVTGSYFSGGALSDSNYVTVKVNIATGGAYKIFTNTKNGFSFQDSGYIGPGLQSIKLKATGTPVLAEQTDFQVAFDTSFCSFSVTVINNTPADYILVGSAGTCSNPTVNGNYSTGTALNASNTVTLEVAVTTPGSYSVTTPTVGGITFSGTGNLTTPGLQIITLKGSGTPTTAGDNVFPVSAGNSTCNFTVPVTAGTGGTGNTDPNLLDSAWQFSNGAKTYNGPFYDVFDTTINNTYGIVLLGYTRATGDTIIQFGTFFTDTTIQTGTYSSRNFAAFYFTDYRDTANPGKIYTADFNTQTANTQLTISAYDQATRIITGTFTGTAMNASGIAVPISNGKFKARVR